jgi:hypothetical protein
MCIEPKHADEDDLSVLPVDRMKPRRGGPAGPEVYSERLIELIHHCLRPAVQDRPSAAELLRETKAGYKRHREAAMESRRGRANPPQDYKVRLTNGEMNELHERGDAWVRFSADWEADQAFFDVLRKRGLERCGDPDDPPLCPPRELWQEFYDTLDRDLAAVWQRDRNQKLPEDNMAADKALMHRADWFERVGDWAYVAGIGDQPRPRAKRLRDWQEADNDDREVRRLLGILRIETAGFADDKPVVLLEYILNTEKQDIEATVDILNWLYNRSRKAPAWTSKKRVQTIAKDIQKAWKKRFSDQRSQPSYRECLYFAGSAATDNIGVAFTLEKMAGLLRVDDAADNNARVDQDEPEYDLELNESIRLLRSLIAHVAQERPLHITHWSDGFLTMILEQFARDAHVAFDVMKASHLLELTVPMQARMLETRPRVTFLIPVLQDFRALLAQSGDLAHPRNSRIVVNDELLVRALINQDLNLDGAMAQLVQNGQFWTFVQQAEETRRRQRAEVERREEQEARRRFEEQAQQQREEVEELEERLQREQRERTERAIAETRRIIAENRARNAADDGNDESEVTEEGEVAEGREAAAEQELAEEGEMPKAPAKSPSYAPVSPTLPHEEDDDEDGVR